MILKTFHPEHTPDTKQIKSKHVKTVYANWNLSAQDILLRTICERKKTNKLNRSIYRKQFDTLN